MSLIDSPCESVEVLMEGLRQNWMKRNVALQTFEQELTEAAQTILGGKDGNVAVLDTFVPITEVSSHSPSARLKSTTMAESVEENVAEDYLHRELKRFKPSTELEESGESDEDNIEASLRDALDSTVVASQSKRRSRIKRQWDRVKACKSISGQYKAARMIATSVRHWYYNRNQSARVIQRFFRGWVARKRIAILRAQRVRLACCLQKWQNETHILKRARACIKIQSLWRGHVARLSIHRMKHHNAFRTHMEELFRLYLERRENARRTEAASTVQSAWKTFIAQRYFGALRRSALIFQSIWRGARVRRAVRQYRLALGNATHVEIELADADENDFAEIDTDPLQDVLSNFKAAKRNVLGSTEQPSRERDAPEAFVATCDEGSQHAAATEYFIRRRKRHLRQQHRRQRSDELKSDPSRRLARFLSNAAKIPRR